MQTLSGRVKELELRVRAAEDEVNTFAAGLPNKLHPSVPKGDGEEDNQLVRAQGVKQSFAFKPKEHFDLGEALGLIDFERAGKVAGARFAFLRGAAAKLERALTQFMLDLHVDEHGFEEILPPFVVNSASLYNTGQFPKFRDDVFHLVDTDYHLIPTAEVPITNFYAGEILKESQLPIKMAAYSPCFRSEAGSHGRDTRGLIRQHQFEKVEMVMFAHPERSGEMHEQLVTYAETVLHRLELPYRTMLLCSKDIGFGASKCYDIEVWLPGQNAYREISSCSNFEDFQARRANIRFKSDAPKAKPQFVHTLNGSGLAIGRTVVAILENYQNEDGTVRVPSALKHLIPGATLGPARI